MSEPLDEVEVPQDADLAEEEPFSVSREEWAQTQQDLAAARELVQAVQQARGQQEGPLSGYDPEFRQELDRYLEQKLSPYAGFQEQALLQEAEERARDILADAATREGEFDLDMARLRAEQLLPQFNERYGVTPKAAEAALNAAAQAQRDYEKSVRDAAVEQYQNQLRGITQAPRDASVNGNAAAGVHVSPPGANELDVVKHYFPTAR